MHYNIDTRCIHGDPSHRLSEENRAISFPIYQTASFSHIKPGHNQSGFDYSRESNPTRQRLEETVSALEGAEGVEAVTGMGLMIGIKTIKPAGEVVSACMEKGVLCLTAKDKVRLLPALNIPMETLQKAVEVLKAACV